MHNFTGEYLQGIERVGWGWVILLRSILTLSKTCDVDAKFAKEVSSSSRKGKMQMQLYRPSRLKSICKFKEEQVVDTLAWKRVSAEANIKAVQIHQLPKEHLRQWINPGYRYIRHHKRKNKKIKKGVDFSFRLQYNNSCLTDETETKHNIGVWLSLARAPGLGPGGRRFESCHPDSAGVVQW